MTRFFIDSNVFFYAKIMDAHYGTACARIIRRISSGALEASTSALVPVEVANAMRKFGLAGEIAAEVRALYSLGIEVLSIDAPDGLEAIEASGKFGISPYDCLHAIVMKRNGLREIISADREFDKLDWVNRTDPSSLDSR